MVDLLAALARFDASALVALLLVALLTALRYIGNGLMVRLDAIERTMQQHTTLLAVLRTRVGMVEEDRE